MSAFSLYPTTEQQYTVNKFLWQAANDYSFRAHDAAKLFQRNVFIISMPAPLFDFLTTVTWEQLEEATLYVLVTLAHDANGFHVLHEELAPSLAAKLANGTPPNVPDPCDHRTFRLLMDLVMERIMWTGPWILPTTLCFLSASDMTDLLARRYGRPIFATPEKFELVHSMMWSIFRDWQTYRHLLVRLGGMSRLKALELMARTISRGAQSLVENAIRTLLQLTVQLHDCHDLPFDLTGSQSALPLPSGLSLKKNYLSVLPMDVVLSKLLPKLCEAYASDDKFRRRTRPVGAQRNVTVEMLPPRLSLKNWVLEDATLHHFYHNANGEDADDDMSDADPVEIEEGEGDEEPGQIIEAVDIVEEEEVVEVVDMVAGAGEGVEEVVEVVPLQTVDSVVEMHVEDSGILEDSDASILSVESLDRGAGASTGWEDSCDDGDDVECLRANRLQRRRLDEQGSFQVVHRNA